MVGVSAGNTDGLEGKGPVSSESHNGRAGELMGIRVRDGSAGSKISPGELASAESLACSWTSWSLWHIPVLGVTLHTGRSRLAERLFGRCPVHTRRPAPGARGLGEEQGPADDAADYAARRQVRCGPQAGP